MSLDRRRPSNHVDEVFHQTPARAEIAGVEDVPKLQHDEEREEDAQFVWVAHVGCGGEVGEMVDVEISQQRLEAHVVAMAQHLPYSHENGEEHQARSQNHLHHAPVDNLAVGLSRIVVHHPGVGGQRRQRHGCEGVHDEVHPEHLGHVERRVQTHKCAVEHDEAGRHIDGHLEHHKPTDVEI